MTQELERQLIELIATDRISIPVKSMAGKLDRARPKLAKSISLDEYDGCFFGERVNARVEYADLMKARGMREGIELFSQQFPKYGAILNGFIEGERALRECHLYFGMNEGCRLTAEDYKSVMKNLGFSETEAHGLYPALMDTSRKLSRQRNEDERRILIG